MVYWYAAFASVILFLTLVFRGYKKDFFKDLNKKENPLRIFYGLSLKLYDLFKKAFPQRENAKVDKMIKSLCVKENTKNEKTLYFTKKISLCTAAAFAAFLIGFLYCAANGGADKITTLIRNEYGGGEAEYDLIVNYADSEETVEIEISERLYTDDEIYDLFEEAYEAVKEEMLGENESPDEVSSALELVSDYGEIDIYWEIEDTDILDYNGEIAAEIPEGDSITINLYATFTLEDVSAVYTYPVTLVSETLSEKELLISYIMEEIEENNSLYESEVVLPSDINGEDISFAEISQSNEFLFLILGIAAVFALAVFYDKKLEEKMKERQNQMMIDFTEIVSKLSLLYEAGLSIYMSWERIIADYEKRDEKEEHFAYKEMKLAAEKIKSGMNEAAAYEQFGQRCGLHPYIKLGNLLSQNLSKGSRGMKALLSKEAEDAFEQRKQLARKKGEEASTKLLLPMILLLVVVIVIVAVPALMSISF